MNIGILVVIILTVIVFALIFSKRDDNQELESEDSEDIVEMEKVFFEKIQAEHKAQYQLASIYSQYDVMFIKSLFQSEQIPFHIEYENVSRLIPGLRAPNYNNTVLTILEDDYDDAVKILEEYIRSKSNSEDTNQDRIRNIAEIAIAGRRIPSSSENTIEIYYKNT